MPFWQEWALLDGLKEYNDVQSPEAALTPKDDYYDPRFPRASRGDVMASPEELMGLGIQYFRE